MHNYRTRILTAAAVVALTLGIAGTAAAQGKIVCWKDKAGKTIGCGDKVPPEYQSSSTKELDSRGITRKTTESVEDANQRRQREQDTARVKAEEDRKALDQRRQDTALLETYSNEKEIDLKRDRDLGVVDLQIEQLTTALKNTTGRHNDAKGRHEQASKGKAGASAQLKDEVQRSGIEKERLEKTIEAKHKEKEDLRQRYADYRKRYTELKSGTSAPSASASAKK